jgi:hypothetical protein
VDVLSHLSSIVLVEQNLGLALASLVHSRNFSLFAKRILVRNVVVGQILACGNVFEDNNITSINGLALFLLTETGRRLNAPHSIVSQFAGDRNFLVAGEASIHKRG